MGLANLERKNHLIHQVEYLSNTGCDMNGFYTNLYAKGYSTDEIHTAVDHHLYHNIEYRLLLIHGLIAGIVIFLFLLIVHFAF